jgi:hypothetical protein
VNSRLTGLGISQVLGQEVVRFSLTTRAHGVATASPPLQARRGITG